MKYKRISGMPLWEIQDWDLPDIEITPARSHLHSDGYSDPLRIEMAGKTTAWQAQWNTYTKELSRHIREDEQPDVLIDQMWKNYALNFEIPNDFGPLIINDKPGYTMCYHQDNRAVVGVVLINLKDNVDRTEFMFPPTSDWEAPTKKGTGIFMLNNGDKHKVDVTEDRLIAYQTIGLKSMLKSL